jgi:hypothetical protein
LQPLSPPNFCVSPKDGASPILPRLMHLRCAYLHTSRTWQRVHFHMEMLDSPLNLVFSHHGTLRANRINAYISIVAICIYISPTTGETSN